MNGVSGAGNYLSSYYSLQGQYGYSLGNNTSTSAAATSAGTSQSSSDALTGQLNGLVSLTRYAMDAMGLSSDSKVTFTQLNKYREQLEEEFNQTLRQELGKVNVSNVPDFTISMNEDGSVTINSQSEHREKLQKIFDDNPELVKTYQKIEALSGIDKARESMQIAPHEMRKRIQIEAMSSWWAQSNPNAGASFSNYSNGALSLLQGINVSI